MGHHRPCGCAWREDGTLWECSTHIGVRAERDKFAYAIVESWRRCSKPRIQCNTGGAHRTEHYACKKKAHQWSCPVEHARRIIVGA